ncbi:hypothetical protein, partial [uncultured Gimesia sp.]|uniref:hypothetical protein n=1 Tax=uncultured Gimesia sp. TaxID=1678688 RepID=UPI00261AD8CC
LDRIVFFIPDVLRQDKPDMLGVLSYPELTGSAYGIYSKAGHLFLHTNRAFFSIPDAVSKFVKNEYPDTQNISSLKMQASDFFIGQGDRLFLLDNSDVLELPLLELIGSSNIKEDNNIETSEYEPDWYDTPLLKSEAQRDSYEDKFQLQEMV